MNTQAFRHFYDYHFSENRRLWDTYVMALSDEQFTQPVGYSLGSVQRQILHLISVDAVWFYPLMGLEAPEWLQPADFTDRASIRAHWDTVEESMRAYLAGLRDEMLFEQPFPDHEEDHVLILWQVLLHVVNHGTDHRAQVLRVLHDLGIKTTAQDYIFYVYDHPPKKSPQGEGDSP